MAKTSNPITGNLPPKETGSPTANYFNNFFNTPHNTSADKNNALVSFFEEWTGSKESGATLTATVLYTAQKQGIDPMEILDQFQGLDKKQLNSYLTLFLNLNRVNTSLLGISNQPQTNKYIQRAILP